MLISHTFAQDINSLYLPAEQVGVGCVSSPCRARFALAPKIHYTSPLSVPIWTSKEGVGIADMVGVVLAKGYAKGMSTLFASGKPGVGITDIS